MKKIINLLLALVLTANLAACWTEDIPEAGAARHQVTGLTATPGDEEVLLSWSMPEGWNPTDFIVYYTNTDSKTVTRRTGGLMNCTVTGLANGTQYTFYVQAVYGENISNYVGITGKPSTSRFPVTDLAAEAGDAYVTLTWSKPSTTVLSYTLSYYNEDATGDVTELPLDKDATAITLDNLVNDKNYYFSLVANYAKGTSEAATVKAMPTQAIPYSLDRDKAAKNQPITFTFNTADYPTATDVKWTFPGDVVKQGTVVKYGLGSVGTQTVKLSATINGNVRTWNLEVEIREYVVYSTDWAQDGSNYNGFKGSCPVFSPDGKTVYIITFNKVAGLYAFDLATGSEKWRYIPAAKSNSYNMLGEPRHRRHLLRNDRRRTILCRDRRRPIEVDLHRGRLHAKLLAGRQRLRHRRLHQRRHGQHVRHRRFVGIENLVLCRRRQGLRPAGPRERTARRHDLQRHLPQRRNRRGDRQSRTGLHDGQQYGFCRQQRQDAGLLRR